MEPIDRFECPACSKWFRSEVGLDGHREFVGHEDETQTVRVFHGTNDEWIEFRQSENENSQKSEGTKKKKSINKHQNGMKKGLSKGIKRKCLPFEQHGIPSENILEWIKKKHSVYASKLGLHKEIVELARYLQPTNQEKKTKQEIVKKVQSVAQEIWRKSKVRLYGSCAVGLDIYSSDIDLNVDNWSGKNKIQHLAEKQKRKRIAKECLKFGKLAKQSCSWMDKLEVRSGAKIPIVNFFTNGVEVDVSLQGIGSEKNTHFVEQSVQLYGRTLINLATVLKMFLQQLDMDKPFTGGLGSFRIYVMIVNLLEKRYKRMGKKQKKQDNQNIGELLIEFYKMYGTRQKCHPNWPKVTSLLNAGTKPFRVEINFKGIRLLKAFADACRAAYDALTTSLGDYPSALSKIIFPFQRSFKYAFKKKKRQHSNGSNGRSKKRFRKS